MIVDVFGCDAMGLRLESFGGIEGSTATLSSSLGI